MHAAQQTGHAKHWMKERKLFSGLLRPLSSQNLQKNGILNRNAKSLKHC